MSSPDNVIPFQDPEPIEHICSFCKRHQSQVPKMFSNGRTGLHLKCVCSHCLSEMQAKLQRAQQQEARQ